MTKGMLYSCQTCDVGVSIECRHYDETMRLVRKHTLGFLNNPGGGEFTLPTGQSIQIGAMGEHDDDCERLMAGLRKFGLEE